MIMRKMLLDFLIWAFCLGLLVIIWILGLNDHRGWAAVVMVLVVATMVFWAKIKSHSKFAPRFSRLVYAKIAAGFFDLCV
jgi:hypothetical protein